jgi:hypothetical protein
MDDRLLDVIETCFLKPHANFLTQLDEAVGSLRGPALLPSRVLLTGLIYVGLEPGPNTQTRLARFYSSATEGQLRRIYGMPLGATHQHLPAPQAPARDQLYRTFDALSTGLGRMHRQRARSELTDRKSAAAQRHWQRQEDNVRALLGAADRDQARFALTAELLADTAPAQSSGAPFTVDTTNIDADCRPVSQARLQRGEFAADPDARWRVRDIGPLDVDAPQHRKSSGWDKLKKTFGYECITIGGTEDNVSYVYAAHTVAANEYDVPVALRLLDRMAEDGSPVGQLISDRGYSAGIKWLDGQRQRGILPTYDLKHLQGARDPDFQGCRLIQGWPHLPQVPKRLWNLERPGLQAPIEKIEKFGAAMAERKKYALVAHGKPTPTGVRVRSPLYIPSKSTKGRLGCPKVPGSMRGFDKSLVPCPGNHGLDEACCLKTATFKAAYAPLSYQTPNWGTKEWEEIYAKRSNVERGYSTLKNPDVIGLTKGMFHMRGLPNFSLLVTCMWIAHNLYLRLMTQTKLTKSQRAVTRARRTHRRRSQNLALTAALRAPIAPVPNSRSRAGP